jgi:formylglycine-generating enzyme required for sulfatase activity
MGSLPSEIISEDENLGKGNNYPVYYVNWYDALVFCNMLSIAEGLTPAYRINNSTDPSAWGTVPTSSDATWNAVTVENGSTGYRLPTEAQWEYAAKGGNGLPGNYTYAGSNTVGDVAWYTDNSVNAIHAVGTKTANGLGIYDMSGNVREWCWDWYGDYARGRQTDPTGATSGANRVHRGGSAGSSKWLLRSAFRTSFDPDWPLNGIGFRLVRP